MVRSTLLRTRHRQFLVAQNSEVRTLNDVRHLPGWEWLAHLARDFRRQGHFSLGDHKDLHAAEVQELRGVSSHRLAFG